MRWFVNWSATSRDKKPVNGRSSIEAASYGEAKQQAIEYLLEQGFEDPVIERITERPDRRLFD